MAQEGDIVFMIGADVAGLTRAGQSGERSLVDMEKAAKALERQIGKIGEAGVAFQRDLNKLTGVTTEFAKSARDSAAAFEAFDRARGQVDSLRASIDPLFAASKRYEAALLQLDNALEMGAISAREHAQMMDQVAAAYLRADNAADASRGGFGRFGGGLQQVGFQIQDFAVQVGAGTSATQAFAQQFPQMASAFGPWGVAVGTAVGVLLPLGAAFLSASDDATKLNEQLDRQKSALEGVRMAAESLRLERGMLDSGAQSEDEQRTLERLAELTKQRAEIQGRLNQLLAVGSRAAGYAEQVEAKRAILEAELATNEAEIKRLNTERALTAAAKASKAVAQEMQSVMNQLANSNISSPWQSVLGWIQQATAAAREYARASMVYSGRGGDPRDFGANAGQSNTFDTENFTVPAGFGGAGGGGGGGGGTNPIEAQLEALRQQMMTEEQIEMESYAKRQEMLRQALEQKLLTQKEYAALMQQSESAHQFAMLKETNAGVTQSLNALGSLFQGSKEISAGIALANSWLAFTEVLKDPSYVGRPLARFAAAAGALSSGLNAVRNIKSASRGGGGVSTAAGVSGAGNSAPASPSQTLNFTITNDPFGFGERIVRQIAAQLNETQRNGSSIKATVA